MRADLLSSTHLTPLELSEPEPVMTSAVPSGRDWRTLSAEEIRADLARVREELIAMDWQEIRRLWQTDRYYPWSS